MQFNTILLASLLYMGSAACLANTNSSTKQSNSPHEPVAINSSESLEQRQIQQEGDKKQKI